MAAQPRAQFVQLEVREPQLAEGPLMQRLSVLACAREPPRDSGLSGAENPRGRRGIQPFGQCSQYHGNLVRRGFQTVEGGVASSTEGATAGLTAVRLDLLRTTVLAIADQRVELRIGIAEVGTLRVGASEPFGVYAFGGSPPAFHLAPGSHRRRRSSSTRRGKGGQTTGGAIVWATGLEETGKGATLGSSL
jgi:hypothetical protein